MNRYKNSRINKSTPKYDTAGQSVPKMDTTVYEEVPQKNDDIIVITQHGDRFDN